MLGWRSRMGVDVGAHRRHRAGRSRLLDLCSVLSVSLPPAEEPTPARPPPRASLRPLLIRSSCAECRQQPASPCEDPAAPVTRTMTGSPAWTLQGPRQVPAGLAAGTSGGGAEPDP